MTAHQTASTSESKRCIMDSKSESPTTPGSLSSPTSRENPNGKKPKERNPSSSTTTKQYQLNRQKKSRRLDDEQKHTQLASNPSQFHGGYDQAAATLLSLQPSLTLQQKERGKLKPPPPASMLQPRPGAPPPQHHQQQMKNISCPHDNDVLCGRGNFVNSHAGNAAFRHLVKKYFPYYLNASKPEKPVYSSLIYEHIRNLNPPGRFLKQHPNTELWDDIGERKAIDKTRQALREGVPVAMNKLEKLRREHQQGANTSTTASSNLLPNENNNNNRKRDNRTELDKGDASLNGPPTRHNFNNRTIMQQLSNDPNNQQQRQQNNFYDFHQQQARRPFDFLRRGGQFFPGAVPGLPPPGVMNSSATNVPIAPNRPAMLPNETLAGYQTRISASADHNMMDSSRMNNDKDKMFLDLENVPQAIRPFGAFLQQAHTSIQAVGNNTNQQQPSSSSVTSSRASGQQSEETDSAMMAAARSLSQSRYRGGDANLSPQRNSLLSAYDDDQLRNHLMLIQAAAKEKEQEDATKKKQSSSSPNGRGTSFSELLTEEHQSKIGAEALLEMSQLADPSENSSVNKFSLLTSKGTNKEQEITAITVASSSENINSKLNTSLEENDNGKIRNSRKKRKSFDDDDDDDDDESSKSSTNSQEKKMRAITDLRTFSTSRIKGWKRESDDESESSSQVEEIENPSRKKSLFSGNDIPGEDIIRDYDGGVLQNSMIPPPSSGATSLFVLSKIEEAETQWGIAHDSSKNISQRLEEIERIAREQKSILCRSLALSQENKNKMEEAQDPLSPPLSRFKRIFDAESFEKLLEKAEHKWGITPTEDSNISERLKDIEQTSLRCINRLELLL